MQINIPRSHGSGQGPMDFTNLDFPEIAGDFPPKKLPLGGKKVVWGRELIWPNSMKYWLVSGDPYNGLV